MAYNHQCMQRDDQLVEDFHESFGYQRPSYLQFELERNRNAFQDPKSTKSTHQSVEKSKSGNFSNSFDRLYRNVEQQYGNRKLNRRDKRKSQIFYRDSKFTEDDFLDFEVTN